MWLSWVVEVRSIHIKYNCIQSVVMGIDRIGFGNYIVFRTIAS